MQRFWEKLKALRRLLLAHRGRKRIAHAKYAGIDRRSVPMGSETVHLEVTQFGAGGLRYINLHENETTAVHAAASVLSGSAGQLIVLRAGGQRLLAFRDGLRPYAFDPNRIFTEAGLRRTLQFHASDTPRARAAVRGLRDAVLELLDGRPDEAVVALHNNRGGAYSVRSYQPGAALAADAQALAIDSGKAQEDFFLVTRRTLFEQMREGGFNVVWQANTPEDDGSLSIHFQRAGRAYVNVEAHFDHLEEQRQMLATVGCAFSSAETAPGRSCP
jgi:hypothetical protein